MKQEQQIYLLWLEESQGTTGLFYLTGLSDSAFQAPVIDPVIFQSHLKTMVSTLSVKGQRGTQTSCQFGQVRLLSLFSHLPSASASSAAPSFILKLPLKHVYKVRSGRSNNN